MFSRRTFLGAIGSVIASEYSRSVTVLAQASNTFSADPFQLGVASGDPAWDGFVLWTRLAPDPLRGDEGLANPIHVRWEVATDESMHHVVKRGQIAAVSELGHSVHVEVSGLKPGRKYFYRFHAGGATSPIGRTKTAPALRSQQDSTKFAFISCQHYENGYYNVHREIAQDDLDVVLFLGDYMYEHHTKNSVRRHRLDSPSTLDEYRRHHAQYKEDVDLQACHAAHPWLVTFDDHEVEDNWASTNPGHASPKGEDFLARRVAAFQAYYENMPLRIASLPKDNSIKIYRSLPYGQLARFTVVDTRQFRSKQPCDDGRKACAARMDAGKTMMGFEQERWFANVMRSTTAKWNTVANQVMIAQLKEMPTNGGSEPVYNMDQWDGYTAARQRLFAALAAGKPSNPVFVTGDVHQTWVGNLKPDFDVPSSPVVATELVGTSVTSGGNGQVHGQHIAEILRLNPHVVYNDARRGYFRCELTSSEMRSEERVVSSVTEKGTKAITAATFLTKDGLPGVTQVN
ncbi:MAG TPA: alkaline phosphatase D family protein [Edaphobacter sp.]|nr:alkaline phosphatase D family protein [Edaphobacter sp.]